MDWPGRAVSIDTAFCSARRQVSDIPATTPDASQRGELTVSCSVRRAREEPGYMYCSLVMRLWAGSNYELQQCGECSKQ